MDIVDQIIKIDRKADDRLVDANNKKKNILRNSREEADMLKRKLEAQARQQIQEIENMHQQNIDDALKKIDENYSAKKHQLDDAFERSHKSIINSIFKSIVGDDVD